MLAAPSLAMLTRPRLALLLILITFLFNAGFYNQATPPFEAPDAYYHFAVIQHINETGSRPPGDNPAEHPWRQMAFHAPLYYYVSALLISPLDTRDFEAKYPRNPHAQVGEPSAEDNQNFVAHVDYDLRDTELAILIVRLFSTLLGLVTLVSIYAIGRLVFPVRPSIALLATFTASIIPQFAYMNSIISNDNLVTALSTLGLAVLFWLINSGVTWKKLLLLSVILALNSLAKASGMALYPVVVVGLSYAGLRDKWSLRRWFTYGAIGLGVWAVIAGWWYWENWTTLDDPFATTAIADATGQRGGDIDFIAELRGLYYSYWGLFGWFNIPAPVTFYYWTAGILLVSLAGVIARRLPSLRPAQKVMIGLLVLHAVLVVGAWWQFNLLVTAGQGRLWFPFIGGAALLIGVGLKAWRGAGIIPLAGLMVGVLAFPVTLIAPAFAPSEPVANWQPSEDMTPVALREPWQSEACLTLWVNPPDETFSDGELTLPVAFEAQCSLTGFWSFFVHVVDLDLQTCQPGDTHSILWQRDTMPGGGDLPLPAIKPGDVYVEEYTVDLSVLLLEPGREYALEFGFYDAGGSFIRMLIEGDTLPAESINIGQCGTDTVSIPLTATQ
ncbi:MAG: glycosyltransferase family 39 protein [Chloroflexi bacterium]|nr:glycosyltransferase family 39 protein [Chloroflexota bacterium]